MSTLALILLMAFDIACYTGQTFLGKLFSMSYRGDAKAASPVFASVYGLVVGLSTIAFSGGMSMPSPSTWACGLSAGLMLFLFNLAMVHASQTGPYSVQSIIMMFGCVLLPLLFCAFYWGERLLGVQLVGVALVLVSFVVINLKGASLKGAQRSFFGWVMLLFVTNGAYSILMDAQQRLMQQTQRSEMIAVTFLTSAVISIGYLLVACRGRSLAAFRMGARSAMFCVGSSLCASVAVNVLLILLAHVQTAVLYSVQNCTLLLVSVLLSAMILHEKLEKHVLIGIGIGLVGIVALSV